MGEGVPVNLGHIPAAALQHTTSRMHALDPLVSSTTRSATGDRRKCESMSLSLEPGTVAEHFPTSISSLPQLYHPHDGTRNSSVMTWTRRHLTGLGQLSAQRKESRPRWGACGREVGPLLSSVAVNLTRRRVWCCPVPINGAGAKCRGRHIEAW